MRAAVIGTNWGQVHMRALREHDVEVVAVCGRPENAERTAAAAAILGVEHAFDDPHQLLELDLDLVSIATPAPTHAPLLRLFSHLPVICEKPLLGMTGDAAQLPNNSQAWVNYAFPFLDSASLVAREVLKLGQIGAMRISSSYDIDLSFTPAEWFLEVASHPLSFAVNRFGAPRLVRREDVADPDATVLHLRLGNVPAEVACRRVAGLNGIEHRIAVEGVGGLLELTGSFCGNEPWRFGPVRLDGQPIGDAEGGPDDPWMRANMRSIGMALMVIRGEFAASKGMARGLFSVHRARAIDDCVREAFG